MPVQMLKFGILPLDLPRSGPVTHSGEILTAGKSQKVAGQITQDNEILLPNWQKERW